MKDQHTNLLVEHKQSIELLEVIQKRIPRSKSSNQISRDVEKASSTKTPSVRV